MNNKIINKIIYLVLVLSILATATAVENNTLGFDDFKPNDPIKTLKDIGVWDIVTLVLAVLFGGVIIAVVVGLGWCVGRVGIASLRNDSSERRESLAAMFSIISAVLLFFCLVTGFFFVWAML